MPNKTIAIWSFYDLVLVLILQDFLCNLFATLIKVDSVKRMTITLVKDRAITEILIGLICFGA